MTAAIVFRETGVEIARLGKDAGLTTQTGELPALRQEIDLRDHQIITAVACEDVLCQTLRLPTTDAGELKQMLDLQIDNLSPLPLEEIVYGFEPLETLANETRILLAIARKTSINERVSVLEDIGWAAQVVTVDALAVFRQLTLPADAKLHTLVLLSPTAANIIVHTSGKIVAVRSLLADGDLRDELQRTLVAAEVEYPGCEIGRTTFTTWSEAARPRLAELTQTWPDAEILQNGSSPQPAASVCQSAGTMRLNLLPDEWREQRRKAKTRQLLIRSGIALAAVYVLALVGFLAFMGIRQAQLSSVQGEIRKLDPDFKRARELSRTLVAMQKQLDTRYSALEVLREVSQLLPENVKLNGFSFKKDENVVLRAQAQSAAFATDYISRLEHSEMFSKVTPGNMRSEPGTGLTKFDVTCTLKSASYGNQ